MANSVLRLKNGLDFVKSASPAPANVDHPFVVTQSRATTDIVTINYLGQTLTSTYAEFTALFDGRPSKTYSILNAFGNVPGGNPPVGPWLSVQEVLNALSSNGVSTSFSEFCNTPNAKITIVSLSDGFTASILGKQVLDGGGRKRFINFEYNSGTPIDCGFIRVANGSIRFAAIGQQTRWEVNSPMFVTFSDGGISITFSKDQPISKWPDFSAFVGPEGGTIGGDIKKFEPNESGDVHTVPAGSFLRFGIDNDDLLNGSRLYFRESNNVNEQPPLEPSETFDEPDFDNVNEVIYNVPPPQFTASGGDYPVGYTLGAKGTEYYFTLMAYGPGRENSNIMHFRFRTE